jgi:2,5-diamino-6-(ribosylamino)-4(3H)-pyrimidinone 5'-phosphate reductase
VSRIYRNLELPPQAWEDTTTPRPYVFINTVASVDGKATVGGKASGLGTAVDRSVMRTLRSKADAVVIGGGTLRAEKLSLSLDADDPRPRPLAVILTNNGELPLERNLVRDNRQSALVLLSEAAEKDVERKLGGLAEVRRVPAAGYGSIDPAKALEILKAEYDIDLLLCEGGPTLNHALISANLADELFVTLAPMLVGGGTSSDEPVIPNGSPDQPKRMHLLSVYLASDELFLRYALNPGVSSP